MTEVETRLIVDERREPHPPSTVALSAGETTMLVDCAGSRLPRVVYWGARLPTEQALEGELGALAQLSVPRPTSDSPDRMVLPSVVPEQWTGWPGTPGIEGHRDGTVFSPHFETTSVRIERTDGSEQLIAYARDSVAELDLDLRIEMLETGLVRMRATISNPSAGAPYTLNALNLLLPVPAVATEILDFSGRHLRERVPQRHPFVIGSHRRDGRRGKTGSDASLLVAVGATGFGFRSGEVWAVQTAWSGNHITLAERSFNGSGVIGGGELILPGEVILRTGDSYESPWIYAAYGVGLDAISSQFHAHLRRPDRSDRRPRPVILNTWEAVYFDHDLAKLERLAEIGSSIGVERFVLDDGWFRHRRDDRAGLGDWQVDETVWPDGLHPLVDTVERLGMDFGLWFEPEMINVDSDAARLHPDWILGSPDRLPLPSRHQQVLDLANPEAFAYVLESMTSLISEYRIAYLKWDHNRDVLEAGQAPSWRAGVHQQTRAAYALMDELHRRFPGLEIESCASGGGRADLEILHRADRIWASDCIDPLERQQNQRWTGLTVPPEMIGSHVGAPTSHSTRRHHSLAFQAGTALFGHFGIEWDLTQADDQERAELAEWIALYKQVRSVTATGTVVRGDHPDPSYWIHGIVSPQATEAYFAFVSLATGVTPPGLIRIPGLDARRRYRIEPVHLSDAAIVRGVSNSPDWWREGIELSGWALTSMGLQAPTLYPEQLVLFRASAVGSIGALEGDNHGR